jgi:hypothetical protein
MSLLAKYLLPAVGLMGLLGVGTLRPHSEQEPVPTPWRDAPERDFFARGMGIVNLSGFFEDECGVRGSMIIGPAVILEQDLHEFPAGTRVIPLSVSYSYVHEGRYLGNEARLIFRPADSTKPYRGVKKYHEPDIRAEMNVYLQEGITWGTIAQESDLIVHSTMNLMP